MVGFCFGKENNSSRRVIFKIELELNNLNSILSRSTVTPVFTAPQGQGILKTWQTPPPRGHVHKHHGPDGL